MGAPTDILNERGQSCEALCISDGCQALVAQHAWRAGARPTPAVVEHCKPEEAEAMVEAVEERGSGPSPATLRKWVPGHHCGRVHGRWLLRICAPCLTFPAPLPPLVLAPTTPMLHCTSPLH